MNDADAESSCHHYGDECHMFISTYLPQTAEMHCIPWNAMQLDSSINCHQSTDDD